MVAERMEGAEDRRGSDRMSLRVFRRVFRASVSIALLSILLCRCGSKGHEASQRLVGRWEVIQMEGMNVPNSFFWFTMDYVEFREDGEVWALMVDPTGTGSDIGLNKTGAYSLVGEDQIEFVGSCRHQDPCTGTYTLILDGEDLEILDPGGKLLLKRAGPPSSDPPPAVVGPSASATPALPQ
jgi:hypothetical protein